MNTRNKVRALLIISLVVLSPILIAGVRNATMIGGIPISDTPPTGSYVLKYNSASGTWEPSQVDTSSISNTSITTVKLDGEDSPDGQVLTSDGTGGVTFDSIVAENAGSYTIGGDVTAQVTPTGDSIPLSGEDSKIDPEWVRYSSSTLAVTGGELGVKSGVYAAAVHSSEHALGQTDPITVSGLVAGSTDTSKRLAPDGAGGVTWTTGGGEISLTGVNGVFINGSSNPQAGTDFEIGLVPTEGTTQTWTYSTAGTSTLVVPAGVYSLAVKMWGAGGSSGKNYLGTVVAPGGGGGYTYDVVTVTPGETITIVCGAGGPSWPIGGVGVGGGADGGTQDANTAGSGGGRSEVSGSFGRIIAGGGGGGSTCMYNCSGYQGGAGGGATGVAGDGVPGFFGSGGTQSDGGAGGGGAAGAANNGGAGQSGGSNPGGGGGGGYYGGGGGGTGSYNANNGAGGGGSGHIVTEDGVTTAGSGSTPGNASDTDRGTAGNGATTIGGVGSPGKIIITGVAVPPARGGYGSYSNLRLVVTSAHGVVLSADHITASGGVDQMDLATVTVGVTTDAAVGSGGPDAAGALDANKRLHFWIISDEAGTTVAGLMSASSTAPTMPLGYALKGYVGSAWTDASQHLTVGTTVLGGADQRAATSSTPNCVPVASNAGTIDAAWISSNVNGTPATVNYVPKADGSGGTTWSAITEFTGDVGLTANGCLSDSRATHGVKIVDASGLGIYGASGSVTLTSTNMNCLNVSGGLDATGSVTLTLGTMTDKAIPLTEITGTALTGSGNGATNGILRETLTGAGSGSTSLTGHSVVLNSGFTGSGNCVAFKASNAGSSSTGFSFPTNGDPYGNTGVLGAVSVSSGSGSQHGVVGSVTGSNSSSRNQNGVLGQVYRSNGDSAYYPVGVRGMSYSVTSGPSVGVIGQAHSNSGASADNKVVGGMFFIGNVTNLTVAGVRSSAMVADNYNNACPILILRDNQSEVLVVDDGGSIRSASDGGLGLWSADGTKGVTLTATTATGRLDVGGALNTTTNVTVGTHITLTPMASDPIAGNGSIWDNSTSGALIMRTSGIAQAVQGSLYEATAGVSVSSEVGATLIPTGQGSVALPASFWKAGKVIEIEMQGLYTTPAGGSQPIEVGVMLGATHMVTSTFTLDQADTDQNWVGRIRIKCRSVGAAGEFMVSGRLDAWDNGGSYHNPAVINRVATFDTTSAGTLDVRARMPASGCRLDVTDMGIKVVR